MTAPALAPDLDALIERLQGAASKARIMDVFARDANGNPMKDHGTSWPIIIVGKDLIEDAAAALVQMREENARLKDALRQANGVRDVFASAVVAQAMQDIDAAKEK
jgi:hypothetical protein